MVIGHGLLGNAFKDNFSSNPNVIIFASGVSNSQEHSELAFDRERQLLENALQQERLLVYFSTCSLLNNESESSPYHVHKRNMEALVRKKAHHMIFRLPQVVGKTSNPHTLTQYIYAKIMAEEPFTIWRYAMRNLIDVIDVVQLVAFLLNEKKLCAQTINIATPTSLLVVEIVKIFEKVLHKKAHCLEIEAGDSYEIDTQLAVSAANQVGIYFDDTYTERLIQKYYGNQLATI